MRTPAVSKHEEELRRIMERVAATKFQNFHLERQLAESLLAMQQIQQFGSVSAAASGRIQAHPMHSGIHSRKYVFGTRMPQDSMNAFSYQNRHDLTQYHSPMQATTTAQGAVKVPVTLPAQTEPNALDLEMQRHQMLPQQMLNFLPPGNVNNFSAFSAGAHYHGNSQDVQLSMSGSPS
jgi:hypothetical protein